MDPSVNIDWERLDRWVRADGTAEELEALRRWVESDPDLVALAEAMRTVGRPEGAERPWDTRGRWQQLQRHMRHADRPLRVATSDRGSRELSRRRWPWSAVAAIVVAAVGASLWATKVEWSAGRTTAGAMLMREVVTHRGQRAVFDLPDGTRVVVAPESRLRIPATYRANAGARSVYLDSGDVFFTVEHNAARPFRVYTPNGIAEDLGTEFLVSAPPTVRRTQVVVVAGEVGLWRASGRGAAGRPLITLAAGQLGQIDSAGDGTVTSNVETSRYVAWVDGTLVFDATPLGEVAATLGRWYDLDVRLADPSLATRRVTARVRNQSAAGVLQSLGLSLGLRVEQKGRTAILSAGSR